MRVNWSEILLMTRCEALKIIISYFKIERVLGTVEFNEIVSSFNEAREYLLNEIENNLMKKVDEFKIRLPENPEEYKKYVLSLIEKFKGITPDQIYEHSKMISKLSKYTIHAVLVDALLRLQESGSKEDLEDLDFSKYYKALKLIKEKNRIDYFLPSSFIKFYEVLKNIENGNAFEALRSISLMIAADKSSIRFFSSCYSSVETLLTNKYTLYKPSNPSLKSIFLKAETTIKKHTY